MKKKSIVAIGILTIMIISVIIYNCKFVREKNDESSSITEETIINKTNGFNSEVEETTVSEHEETFKETTVSEREETLKETTVSECEETLKETGTQKNNTSSKTKNKKKNYKGNDNQLPIDWFY